MAASACTLTITIDLSFDELMIDKDIAKLTKQILRCYTLNRRATAPMQFSLTSFTGKSRVSMEKHNGYEHWDVCVIAIKLLPLYIILKNDEQISNFHWIAGELLYGVVYKHLS